MKQRRRSAKRRNRQRLAAHARWLSKQPDQLPADTRQSGPPRFMLRRPDSYVTFINGCVIQARIPMPAMCISAYAFNR
jgi:hypothetical protein